MRARKTTLQTTVTVLCGLLTLLLMAPTARADRRTFAFTYGYMTLPKGGLEAEHYLDAKIRRRDNPDTAEIENKWPEQTPLAIGDRMEIELSQFLTAPRNGRLNYYGTAILYVVGEGIVPWYAKAKEEAETPAEREAASFDSFPLPEEAWLGGRTTLP